MVLEGHSKAEVALKLSGVAHILPRGVVPQGDELPLPREAWEEPEDACEEPEEESA
jgi:hypothetical protein